MDLTETSYSVESGDVCSETKRFLAGSNADAAYVDLSQSAKTYARLHRHLRKLIHRSVTRALRAIAAGRRKLAVADVRVFGRAEFRSAFSKGGNLVLLV